MLRMTGQKVTFYGRMKLKQVRRLDLFLRDGHPTVILSAL